MSLPSHQERRVLHHGCQRAAAFALGVPIFLLAAGAGCARPDPDAHTTVISRPALRTSAADSAKPPGRGAGVGSEKELAAATRRPPLRSKEPSRLIPISYGFGPVSEGLPTTGSLQLPPAFFALEPHSTDAQNAGAVAIGPEAAVLVITRQDDKVYALVDANGDHRVDRIHVVASGPDTPNGITYRDGALYVAENSPALRIDGIDARLENPPEPVGMTDRLPDLGHHGWRYIRFGSDGWLYVVYRARYQAQVQPRVAGDLAFLTLG